MIYCPQCGTPNKPNSKFCKNCAALLAPSTDARCPICGAMNPQGAANCKNCGTRLAAQAASPGPPDQATPADAPETIAPFNPPPPGGEPDASDQAAEAARPTFTRASSEWLRRVQKMPPPDEPPSEPPAAPPDLPPDAPPPPPPAPSAGPTPAANEAAQPPAASAENVELPEWLRPIEPDDTPPAAPAERSDLNQAAAASAAALPVLGEIKLTGDDYDYGDVGGTITDEMQAQLHAQAPAAESVDDEVELARRLLGLGAAVEVTSHAAQPQADTVTAPIAAAPASAVTETAPEPAATESTVQPVALAPSAEPSAEAAKPEDDSRHPLAAASIVAASAASAHADTRDSEPTPTDLAPTTSEPAPTAPAPALAAEPLEEGELPDWLLEIAPAESEDGVDAVADTPREPEGADVGAAVGAVALWSQLPPLDDAEQSELPDWLREPIITPTDETTGEDGDAPVESPLALPAWMAATGEAPRDPFQVIETSGPLAGITGILPLALAITEPHTLTTPIPTRSNGGRVFQTLLAEPLTAAAPRAAAPETRQLLTTNHLLYALILLAALVPFFLPFDSAGLGLGVTNTPTAVFYDQLQAVPANGAVLLAFEYTPGQAVELDPAARAIVNELATRRANVIAVAANPNGAALAENILVPFKLAHPELIASNAGYVPGADAGLRALASGWLPADRALAGGGTWGSSPLAASVQSMDDLALTVVLAGDDSGLRAWMEQVEPRVQSPMVAATTATLEPQARNYVNAGQLQASLRGLTGAAELELLTNQAGQAVRTVDALSFVSVMLAGIIIVGNVVYWLGRGKRAAN